MKKAKKTRTLLKVSYSRLRTFASCSLQYEAMIEGELKPNYYMVEGSVVHDTLRLIFTDAIKPNKKSITRTFANNLKAEVKRNSVRVDSRYLKVLPKLIQACCIEFEDYQPMLVEWEVEKIIQFKEFDIRFKGIVDLLARKGNDVVLVDWKTTTYPLDTTSLESYKMQLALYKRLLRCLDVEVNNFILFELCKSKGRCFKHPYKTETLGGADEQLKTTLKHFIEYHRTRKGFRCGTCRYCKKELKR